MNKETPTDDGAKRPHEFIVKGQGPVALKGGAPLTRTEALAEIKSLRRAGSLQADAVRLVDLEGSDDDVTPRDLGSFDLRGDLEQRLRTAFGLDAAPSDESIGKQLARVAGFDRGDEPPPPRYSELSGKIASALGMHTGHIGG